MSSLITRTVCPVLVLSRCLSLRCASCHICPAVVEYVLAGPTGTGPSNRRTAHLSKRALPACTRALWATISGSNQLSCCHIRPQLVADLVSTLGSCLECGYQREHKEKFMDVSVVVAGTYTLPEITALCAVLHGFRTADHWALQHAFFIVCSMTRHEYCKGSNSELRHR